MCVRVFVCVCVCVCGGGGLIAEGFNAEADDASNYQWVPSVYQMRPSEVIVIFISGNIDISLPGNTVLCEHFMFFLSLTCVS